MTSIKYYNISFLLSLSLILLSMACSTEKKETTASYSTTLAPNETATVADSSTHSNDMKTILFFGNSLSAAYGLEPHQGFVGLIAKRIDSLQLDYKVINAGNSGETTSGGAARIDWVLENNPVDIFVLELGGNDALRGLPVAEAEKNLQSIIDKVKAKYPQAEILLAGMMAPPNMGNTYTTKFAAIYPRLAVKNDAKLIAFLLDKVGGQAHLNLPDGVHPNVAGHRIVAETVWNELKEML